MPRDNIVLNMYEIAVEPDRLSIKPTPRRVFNDYAALVLLGLLVPIAVAIGGPSDAEAPPNAGVVAGGQPGRPASRVIGSLVFGLAISGFAVYHFGYQKIARGRAPLVFDRAKNHLHRGNEIFCTLDVIERLDIDHRTWRAENEDCHSYHLILILKDGTRIGFGPSLQLGERETEQLRSRINCFLNPSQHDDQA